MKQIFENFIEKLEDYDEPVADTIELLATCSMVFVIRLILTGSTISCGTHHAIVSFIFIESSFILSYEIRSNESFGEAYTLKNIVMKVLRTAINIAIVYDVLMG